MSDIPQQPYFLRAMYEWCVDSGHTPYVTVRVDGNARVPTAYVRNGEIVLNIGPSAVRNLHMDNEWITFSARFGGAPQEIQVPIGNVLAIYARESGEGMSFPQHQAAEGEIAATEAITPASDAENSPTPGPDKPKGRPKLRVVK